MIKINNEVGYFTTRLTGITNEMIEQEGKDLVYVLYEFKKFLGNGIIILDNLIDYFNLTKRNEHRALNDCVLTNQVYINLVNFLK